MRRLFWLALGVTLGVLIVRKLSDVAQRFTPQGVGASLGQGLSDLASSIGSFSAEVRTAMQERETELRAGTGLDGSLGARQRTGRGPQDGTPQGGADAP